MENMFFVVLFFCLKYINHAYQMFVSNMFGFLLLLSAFTVRNSCYVSMCLHVEANKWVLSLTNNKPQGTS